METKQPTIWAVLIITFALATICLAFRLFSRYLKKLPFWWDDFFAIACYFVAIGWLITCPIWMNKGLGLHITDVKWLTANEAIKQSKLILFVAEIIYAFALYFAKMSILCFYWRLFSITELRIPILVLMGMSHVWIIIRTFMAIFHCVPVQAFWDLTITNKRCDIDDKKFFFGSVLVHLLIDVAILSLPVFQIRKLQLRLVQKFGIIAMFLFGFTICVCAIAIIISAANFDTTSIDITWNVTDVVIWASAEVNLVTVSACFPSIRPAVIYFFGRWLPGSTLGSGSNSYGGPNPYSRPRTDRAIGLSNVPTSGTRDAASSTYNLARPDGSLDNNSDFEAHTFDPMKGVSHTIISSKGNDPSREEEDSAGILGISIKKEAQVRISMAPDPVQQDGGTDHSTASNKSFA